MLYWFFFLSVLSGSWFAGPLVPSSYTQRMISQDRYQQSTYTRPRLQGGTIPGSANQNYQQLCCGPNPPPPPPTGDGP
jgi:hypothetical protein